MSNFKVLPSNPLSANEQRETFLPKIPQLILPGQLSLLSYPVEQLIQQVQAFFEQPSIDRPSLLRALKVIGCSLNDGKLISGVERVLTASMVANGGQVYEMMALWAGQRFQIGDFLGKVTPGVRKAIIFLIFQHFLMGSYGRGFGIQQQLPSLLSPVPQAELITQLQKRYEKRGNPLKSVVKKCKDMKSEHQFLKQLLTSFVSSCLSGKSQRLMQFSLTDEQSELQYMLQTVPSATSALISQIKQTITAENVTVMTSSSIKLNTLLQSAAKEWLNEKNNYWLVVQKAFSSSFAWNATKVLEAGKMVLKEGLASECLAVQLLYSYLQGRRFDFAAGDAMIAQQQRENWTEVYRSIGQCSSYRLTNLIILNKTHAPAWWKQTDPRKSTSKPIRKLMDKHSDFLQQREKELAAGNKKMELAFSVFLITDKQTGNDHMITLEQLEKIITDGQIHGNYKQEYPPFMQAQVKKEEVRKQHNIIIEARLVRILKRAKEGLNIDALAKESGYNNETVQLGVKRLVSKSLAEEDGKGGFVYLA